MIEKEARTNIMGSSLDIRNRNWDKVSAHLADYANFKGLRMLSENYTDDYDNLPNGSVVRTLSTMAINGHFTDCFTLTIKAGTHAVQLSFRYASSGIAIRRCVANNWSSWERIEMAG